MCCTCSLAQVLLGHLLIILIASLQSLMAELLGESEGSCSEDCGQFVQYYIFPDVVYFLSLMLLTI